MRRSRKFILNISALILAVAALGLSETSVNRGLVFSEAWALSLCQGMRAYPDKAMKTHGIVYSGRAKNRTGVYCGWTGKKDTSAKAQGIAERRCNAYKYILERCKRLN